jgi:hypothetical protein
MTRAFNALQVHSRRLNNDSACACAYRVQLINSACQCLPRKLGPSDSIWEKIPLYAGQRAGAIMSRL